jgi:hypothetical protein
MTMNFLIKYRNTLPKSKNGTDFASEKEVVSSKVTLISFMKSTHSFLVLSFLKKEIYNKTVLHIFV